MPLSSRTPWATAAFISRPVSSLTPKAPSARSFSTSSEVAPARAISKSWMAVAPFKARAETKPRCMRSMMTALRPHFTTCPPNPQTMARPFRLACSKASTASRKSVPARILGRDRIQPSRPSPLR